MLHLPYTIKKAMLHPPLQLYNLPHYALLLIVHIQQPDTAPRLLPPISSTPRIKQQLPIMLFIPGNMAMSEYNTTGMGKLLPCDPLTMMSISRDVNNAVFTMSYYNLALNRQFPYRFCFLNIAPHSHHEFYCLQLIQNCKYHTSQLVHMSEYSMKDIVKAIRTLLRGKYVKTASSFHNVKRFNYLLVYLLRARIKLCRLVLCIQGEIVKAIVDLTRLLRERLHIPVTPPCGHIWMIVTLQSLHVKAHRDKIVLLSINLPVFL